MPMLAGYALRYWIATCTEKKGERKRRRLKRERKEVSSLNEREGAGSGREGGDEAHRRACDMPTSSYSPEKATQQSE